MKQREASRAERRIRTVGLRAAEVPRTAARSRTEGPLPKSARSTKRSAIRRRNASSRAGSSFNENVYFLSILVKFQFLDRSEIKKILSDFVKVDLKIYRFKKRSFLKVDFCSDEEEDDVEEDEDKAKEEMKGFIASDDEIEEEVREFRFFCF